MNNYDQLDLNDVKEKVAGYASIDDSKSFIMNEEVSFNPIRISRNIKETSELLELIKKDITISFGGIENINSILNQAKKELVLTPIECSKVLNFHNHCRRIKETLNKLEGELCVKDYTDTIYLNENMAIEINKVVDNYGVIKNDASSKLKEIVEKININEKNLYDTAHIFIQRHISSLQENSIYIRNNRVCFLVKNSDKNKFNGFTYGTSASGLASYVEPEQLINLNNNHVNYEEKKEDEITNLLQKLTYIISENADNYMDNYDSLVKLCSSYAKANYGYHSNGILGTINNEKLFIKDVCHPLIDQNNVVSNTYQLAKPYKGIVISGTNTGGKTVGLKCIGLTVLMTYLGIPVIASEVKVPLYDNVYVDIDDNQSISNSLSTFSAHISNINSILNKATAKSLILIDELISGTDPKEAQAISLAILNKIESLNSNFVVTTHYDDIKNYAYENDEILLSSVGFNSELLKPTYKYIENSIGSSNALEIAERYFDDKNLILYARNLISNSISKKDELLNKLSKEIEEYEKLIDKQISINDNIKKIEVDLNEKLNRFEIEKDKLKEKYQLELNDYIDEIKTKALDKLNSIKDKKEISIIKELDNLKSEVINEEVNYEIGDNVKVGEGDRIGTIISINNNKVDVNVNGLTIKTNIDNLTKMPKIVKREYTNSNRTYKKINHELVIVGKHIDEALDEMEIFLDEALSNNLSQVKIIHGLGTGQLKNAVRDKLKKLKFVKGYNDGDYNDGGSAVTMVKLK